MQDRILNHFVPIRERIKVKGNPDIELFLFLCSFVNQNSSHVIYITYGRHLKLQWDLPVIKALPVSIGFPHFLLYHNLNGFFKYQMTIVAARYLLSPNIGISLMDYRPCLSATFFVFVSLFNSSF